MKNEKFLLDIQTKCGDIANEILNAAFGSISFLVYLSTISSL